MFKKCVLLICICFLVFHTCKKSSDSDDTNKTNTNDNEVTSSPNTLNIGGLPSEADFEGAQNLSLEEAQESADTIMEVTETLPLQLVIESETTLTALVTEDNGNGCSDGIFCLVKLFGDIYDLVTKAANCNFKLLLQDMDGAKRVLKQVQGKPIYFVDGFGSIGLGDRGRSICPSAETVHTWMSERGLLPKRENLPQLTVQPDEFYPPTRLVLFKHADGTIRWVVVFFPKDFIGKLAKKVDRFQGIVEEDLDFKVYYGTMENGTEVGKGKGTTNINWDEIWRMTTLLNSGESEGDDSGDSGPPHGKIAIAYDTTSEPKSFTTTFLQGFSIGGGDDTPFVVNQPTTVLKSSSGENYIHFLTNKSFSRPDPSNPEDDGGPMAKVRTCDTPNWPESGGSPFIETKYKDIAEKDYLPTPSKSHLQMIWTNLPEGKITPDDYLVSLIATEGGAYIYGDVEFWSGKRAGLYKYAIRFKIPRCETLTDAKVTEIEDFIKSIPITQGGNPNFEYLDEDGFQNLIFRGQPGPGSRPRYASKAAILALFPEFSTFMLIDIHKEGESPLKVR